MPKQQGISFVHQVLFPNYHPLVKKHVWEIMKLPSSILNKRVISGISGRINNLSVVIRNKKNQLNESESLLPVN